MPGFTSSLKILASIQADGSNETAFADTGIKIKAYKTGRWFSPTYLSIPAEIYFRTPSNQALKLDFWFLGAESISGLFDRFKGFLEGKKQGVNAQEAIEGA